MELFYNDGKPVMDPNHPGQTLSYHVDRKMIYFLDKVKDLLDKKDKDYVTLIDGYEGAGKSTAAMQWGRYVDPTLCLDRVCMTANEFKEQIIKAKQGECVIYDEAVTGLSAGESITRIGKLLKSMMMQMRQKNLFVIVILPTVFELSKYSVLARARSLFHIYENKGKMGYWVGYNRNAMKNLYLKGKKTYAYKVRSKFSGRFNGKYVLDEGLYRKKKEQALFSLDDEAKPKEMSKKEIRLAVQRNCVIDFVKENNLSMQKLINFSKKYDFPLYNDIITAVTSKKKEKYEKNREELMELPEILA